jgi:two-component system sensor histidine kinase CiaH
MLLSRFKTFIISSTSQLAGTYLLIIMVMSIGFSFVLYRVSFNQLGRQIPPNSYFQQPTSQNQTQNQTGHQNNSVAPPKIDQFLKQRIDDGRSELLKHLLYLDIGSLCLGSVVSYVLARRSLKPIEQAMEAQVQFVSDASHELRTPLTAIQTSNEVFLRRTKIKLPDALKLIEQNTEDVRRLKKLSDGLLNLTQHKKSIIQRHPLNLQSLISDAMTVIVPQATQKRIIVHDSVENIAVFGDEAAVIQILVILLDNAIKYSDSRKNIYLTSTSKGKYTYISVQDEGIGIRASDLPHVFRRFYRADNARTNSNDRHGYGLGLSIAKQMAENLNGNIYAESTLGVGSIFTLKLPLASL